MENVPGNVTIRRCERRDLGNVQLIERKSFPDPYTEPTFAFFLLDPRSHFLVACVDGSVVGYVIATRRLASGTIQSIAVLPEFRRRNIGLLLMRSAMAHLAGCRRINLLVSRTNAAAIRLYEALSFRETGRVIKRYYPNGDDALEFDWKPGAR